MLAYPTRLEAFAAGRATQAHHIPAAEHGPFLKVYGQCILGARRFEENILLRQPFADRVPPNRNADELRGFGSGRTIPLGCARRRQQGASASLYLDRNFQPVTAGNAAGWMQKNRVTDEIAFRIK